jgi:3-phenylpropionate/cinnamic acid dioxygenase small subunit
MAVDQAVGQQERVERILLVHDIQEFLYAEAELLDERHFDEWLGLFTDDVHYWMPIRRNVKYGQQDALEETDPASEVSWFDEGKTTLASRVRQLNTGLHWAEEPLSRICHIVSNVQLLRVELPEVTVKSRFVVYRNRMRDETDLFIGKREDVLRQVDGAWKIARRKIILDQNVLLAKNVTVFF